MGKPFYAVIIPLGEHEGPVDPGFGRPGGGSGAHPGGGPIYHPGHPDHGLPSQPGHPGNRPPGSGRPPRPGQGGHPDQGLPEGEEIQIDNELPPVPPEYEDKTIVAIKRPNEDWVFRAYDPVEVDNTLPPSPEPK
jgi:hypothetical protein